MEQFELRIGERGKYEVWWKEERLPISVVRFLDSPRETKTDKINIEASFHASIKGKEEEIQQHIDTKQLRWLEVKQEFTQSEIRRLKKQLE